MWVCDLLATAGADLVRSRRGRESRSRAGAAGCPSALPAWDACVWPTGTACNSSQVPRGGIHQTPRKEPSAIWQLLIFHELFCVAQLRCTRAGGAGTSTARAPARHGHAALLQQPAGGSGHPKSWGSSLNEQAGAKESKVTASANAIFSYSHIAIPNRVIRNIAH